MKPPRLNMPPPTLKIGPGLEGWPLVAYCIVLAAMGIGFMAVVISL